MTQLKNIMSEPAPVSSVSVNLYTQAMSECLSSLNMPVSQALHNEVVVHFLVNMVQGRMLDNLVSRVDEFYHIDDPAFKEDLSSALFEVFEETLFGAFRRTMDRDPFLIFKITRHIVDVEMHSVPPADSKRINRLYLSIFRKYLGYDNLESIVATLQSDPYIQKLILSALSKKHLSWLGYQMFHFLMGRDKQDFMTSAFILYGRNIAPLWEKMSKRKPKLKLHLPHWKFPLFSK